MWYAVDPLFEKYTDISPYVYCAGNPVILVDPDGREGNGFEVSLGMPSFNPISVLSSEISNVVNGAESWYNNADFSGAGWALLNIITGTMEVAAGGASSHTGIGTVVAVDGYARISLNTAKFVVCMSGISKKADAIPSNVGAAVGKVADVATGTEIDKCGTAQIVGGITNDVATFLVTGGNGISYAKMADGICSENYFKALVGFSEAAANTTSFVQSGVSNLQTASKNKSEGGFMYVYKTSEQ